MLLLDNLADTLAAWAQVGLGFGTLFIGILSLINKRKINELTDIVTALANQTKELAKQTEQLKNHAETQQKRYEIEANARIPNFQFYKLSGGEVIRSYFETEQEKALGSTLFLELVNAGTPAQNITIKNDLGNFDLRYNGNRNVMSNETFGISLIAHKKENPTLADYEHCYFELVFKDLMGRWFSQEMIVNPVYGKHDIKSPQPWAKP